ncbi:MULTISPECIES: hypothetical protein [unclassified Coleofasciculus]|uniref:hypothetical protein n=1 Tax=unclassified Coleofasciculus TaxID=2692782 RepID=UPI0018814D58|nr:MULTISPECIES: hypothetical protein [unclassified Coleofasciculus]MBE9129908.1 hypothetical protein [Coleofasciculus sp. LEGE 07081]MBE9151772.1 hypothetical protein [Coleofasciculus sp. LEGE 07092]
MDAAKPQRLEAAGWSIGNASDFLELSTEEATYIEFFIFSIELHDRLFGQNATP